MVRRALASLLISLLAGVAEGAPQAVSTGRPDGVRVYLDCQEARCDLEFIQTEVPFVSYVRDRHHADVHVLITSEPTAAGGATYTVTLIGQGIFAGKDDVWHHPAGQNDSDDLVRRGLVRVLKFALVPYVARTPAIAETLDVSQRDGATDLVTEAAESDPWRSWVFSCRVSTVFNGEQATRFGSINGGISATRVTESWKVLLGWNGFYRRSTFQLDEAVTFTSISRSLGGNALIVKSAGEHWSVGTRLSLGTSTFLNQDLSVRWAPAVEYNLFPYAEATRRQFTIQYAPGLSAFDYREETILGKTSEQLLDQTLTISVALRQPWGSVSSAVEASSLFRDLGTHRIVLFTDLDLRLLKGLSFTVSGTASLIRDQLYLPRIAVRPEEILVQQRQLATSYQYFFSAGFTYRFGSIYSTIVNPRFAGASSGVPEVF